MYFDLLVPIDQLDFVVLHDFALLFDISFMKTLSDTTDQTVLRGW